MVIPFTVQTSTGSTYTTFCRSDKESAWTTCTSPVTLQNLADGAHALAVKAYDSSNQVSAPAIVNWQVNQNAPSVTIVSPLNNSLTSSALALSGACESGLLVLIKVDGVTTSSVACLNGIYSTNVSLSSPDGSKTISVEQADGIGNVGSAQVVVMRDAAVPASPTMSRTSAAISDSLMMLFSVVCPTNAPAVLYTATPTAPLGTNSSWHACAVSEGFSVVAGDGVSSFTVGQRVPRE